MAEHVPDEDSSLAHGVMGNEMKLLHVVKRLQAHVSLKFRVDTFKGKYGTGIDKKTGVPPWEPTLPIQLERGSFEYFELPPPNRYPGSKAMAYFRLIGDALGQPYRRELSALGKKFLEESGKGTKWCIGFPKLHCSPPEDLTKAN